MHKRHSVTICQKKTRKSVQITLVNKQKLFNKQNHANHIIKRQQSNQACEKLISYNSALIQSNKNRQIIKGIGQYDNKYVSTYKFQQYKGTLGQSQNFLGINVARLSEQKVKKKVCADYKLDWNNSIIEKKSTTFRSSSNSLFEKSQQKSRLSREPFINHLQPFINQLNLVQSENQNLIFNKANNIYGISEVRKKVKGIAKCFFKQKKQILLSNLGQNDNKSQINQILKINKQNPIQKNPLQIQQSAYIKNQNTVPQIMIQKCVGIMLVQKQIENSTQKSIEISSIQKYDEIKPIKIKQTENNCKRLLQQKCQQNSYLRFQLTLVEEKLKMFQIQIQQIEKQFSFERIIQLEMQVQQLNNQKILNQLQLNVMNSKIKNLQKIQFTKINQSMVNTQCQTDFMNYLIKNENDIENQNNKQRISKLQSLILNLNQKLQSLGNQKMKSIKQVEQQQNRLKYELQMNKNKYSTLQSVLQMRKKQILNKDQIIKMLISQSKSIFQQNNQSNQNHNVLFNIVNKTFSYE